MDQLKRNQADPRGQTYLKKRRRTRKEMQVDAEKFQLGSDERQIRKNLAYEGLVKN